MVNFSFFSKGLVVIRLLVLFFLGGHLERVSIAEPAERVAGIEPASKAWKAPILPLNHTRELYEREWAMA